MKLTDLFIRRPVVALVVNLMIVIAGVQAIRRLNVRQYPRSENAAITVTTTYVGANAALVRGFITTPLERVIASADGIDYIESESHQNVSIIRARLRLDYDSSKALSEIGSKVDQVRGDLPPEAEVPVLNIESADSQFASAYLSFSSEFLKQNEITDYLVRVVQPRLSAVEGVQRADILGARTFAMRIWLKPDRMAALNVSPAQVRQALATNNYLAAVGQTKGQLVQVNLTANTDLRSPREFEQMVVRRGRRRAWCGSRDMADVVLGAEDYDTEVNFSGQTAVFIGVWSLPNANSLDVIKRVRAEMSSLQKELPEQIKAAHRLRRHRLHPERHQRGGADAAGDAAHRRDRHLPLPRLLPLRPGAGGRHSRLADRRHLPGAGLRLHHQSLDASRHRALGGAGGGRRHRGGGERRAPPARGAQTRGRRAQGRARAGGAHHLHDHHARGRVHAHRLPGRAHRLALPRVRAHARGRGDHLRAWSPSPSLRSCPHR